MLEHSEDQFCLQVLHYEAQWNAIKIPFWMDKTFDFSPIFSKPDAEISESSPPSSAHVKNSPENRLATAVINAHPGPSSTIAPPQIIPAAIPLASPSTALFSNHRSLGQHQHDAYAVRKEPTIPTRITPTNGDQHPGGISDGLATVAEEENDFFDADAKIKRIVCNEEFSFNDRTLTDVQIDNTTVTFVQFASH
uniref:Uncharacterized protein n=1 Tax=Romanomermis culicivorax TaxID=13658 RepID=A0A915HIE0_ROMCU